MELTEGTIVRLKKKHPCGEDRWTLLRVGAELRLECLGCKRLLFLPRREAEKFIREVLPGEEGGK